MTVTTVVFAKTGKHQQGLVQTVIFGKLHLSCWLWLHVLQLTGFTWDEFAHSAFIQLYLPLMDSLAACGCWWTFGCVPTNPLIFTDLLQQKYVNLFLHLTLSRDQSVKTLMHFALCDTTVEVKYRVYWLSRWSAIGKAQFVSICSGEKGKPDTRISELSGTKKRK